MNKENNHANENNDDADLHPGLLYFYSESFAFSVNGICAFLASLMNFGVLPAEEEPYSYSALIGYIFIVLGGVIQFLADLRSFRANEHFGATALGVFSALWFLLGFELVNDSPAHLLPKLLMAAFAVQSVLLLAIAPFLNGYFTCLMGAISATVIIETMTRFHENLDVAIIQGVVQLILSLTCGYGCVASICRSIHERQVLPGFDDAIIENVLWKRKANIHNYSEGIWANPKPLSYFSISLTLIGIYYLLDSDQKIQEFVTPYPLIAWFAVHAFIQWITVFIFGLRKESLHMIDALLNAMLSAIVSYSLFMDDEIQFSIVGTNYGAFVLFLLGLLRVFFTVLSIYISSQDSISDQSFVDLSASALLSVALLLMSINGWYGNSIFSLVRCTQVILLGCSFTTLYNASAEALNSTAQKQLLPVTLNLSKRKIVLRTAHEDAFEDDGDIEASAEDTESMNKDEIIIRHEKFIPPGDEVLFGKCQFESPLSMLFIAMSTFAGLKSIGLFMIASSEFVIGGMRILFLTGVANVVLQTPVLVVAAARGQTKLAIASFSFWIDAIALLALSPTSAVTHNGWTLVTSVAMITIQFAWIVSSARQSFKPLVFAMTIHIVALVAEILQEVPKVGYIFLYASASLLAINFFICILLSGVLLGCHASVKKILIFFRKRLVASNDDINSGIPSHSLNGTQHRCNIAASQHISGFDECVEILNNGGVCCIPTDTVYCLAAKANNPEGICRIYEIKNRPSEKPLSLWVSSLDDIKAVGPEGPGWSTKLFNFMDKIWPGSVSLVVSRGEWLNRFGCGSSADLIGTPDSIALRVPNSTLTVSLLKETGPLAITSANPSGACDCTHHNKVDDLIASKIDFILADGPSPMTIASSVIDVRELDANKIFFYRVGCVPEAFIWEKLREVDQTEKQHLCSNIPMKSLNKVKVMMNLIVESVRCDNWRLYCLHPHVNDEALTDGKISQTKFSSADPRLKFVFETGTSFYTVDEDEIIREGKCEMLLPINDRLGVSAVLSLVNKRNSAGSLESFTEHDLQIANLACTILNEYIDVWTFDQDLNELFMVKFGEHSRQLTSSLVVHQGLDDALSLSDDEGSC